MLLGTVMSMMPGGAPLMDEAYSRGKLPPRTPDQQLGIAIGELLGGAVQLIGSIGLFGGGAVVTTTGAGAIVGAPAMALSAGLATTGVLNITSGVRNLIGALNSMSSGNGGLAQDSARPKEPALTRPSQTGGGKNAQHANMERKAAAEHRYEQLKAELEGLRRTPNKTPAIKEQINKAEKGLRKAKNDMDFTGENHSQRVKGQR